MPIQFNCPACQTQISLPDEYAGLKARCKACDHKLIVPVPPRLQPIATALPADEDQWTSLNQSEPRVRRTRDGDYYASLVVRTILTVLASLLILFCILLKFFAAMSHLH
jgi:hypothetical protein